MSGLNSMLELVVRNNELVTEIKRLKGVIESLREDIEEEKEKYKELERACFP